MTMKSYIERSHERCRKMGIDHMRISSSKILRGEALQRKLEENKDLMVTAGPFMEQLYNFVKSSGFVVILTDGEGCILKILGDENALENPQSLDVVSGTYMDEAHIGTNGIGTALAEGIAVQISEKEHYIYAYHKWTCSAAPIRDVKGNIIGCLDLTGKSDFVHPHTLGMVVAAVNAIQEILKNKEINNKLLMTKKFIETIIDSIDVGILTVGKKGHIKTINKSVLRLLGYTQAEIIGMEIGSIVEGWRGFKEGIGHNIHNIEEEAYLKGKKEKIHCTLTGYPIKDGSDIIQGIVCVIREIKKVKKLANKILGKQAMYTFDNIVGRTDKFLKILNYAKKIADSPSTVLITGESGTGKEVFAQSIHNYSNRRDEAFIALNCGALPRNLIEAELFGYEEGAFTGAKRGGQFGKFELADGGTLFLDEIGEMPLDMQIRLLRVLEEGKLFRIGGTKEITVDVRIIAATNKDLDMEVEKGRFRKDLFYRLNVLPLHLIPLRERAEDIPLLIEFFFMVKSLRLGKKAPVLSEELIKKLIEYPWPGNVRELENKIEQMVNMENHTINWESKDCRVDSLQNDDTDIEVEDLQEIERRHIMKMLLKYKGNITTVAHALKIGRNTLYRKIKKYGIDCSNMERCTLMER